MNDNTFEIEVYFTDVEPEPEPEPDVLLTLGPGVRGILVDRESGVTFRRGVVYTLPPEHAKRLLDIRRGGRPAIILAEQEA